MAYILLGALLLIAGVVYMARAAIFRGRFGDPGRASGSGSFSRPLVDVA